MSYQVLVSRTFQKQFAGLESSLQERVKTALKNLKEDPFRSRPKADIKQIKGTHPPKYRIRIGKYRAVYTVEGDKVKVIEIFARGREY